MPCCRPVSSHTKSIPTHHSRHLWISLEIYKFCSLIFVVKMPPQSISQLSTIHNCGKRWRLTMGWTTGRSRFDPRQGQRTGSGAHPASCTMGTGGPFPGGKPRPGRDADHSPLSSAEVVDE
jgi:hypothetical protein